MDATEEEVNKEKEEGFSETDSVLVCALQIVTRKSRQQQNTGLIIFSIHNRLNNCKFNSLQR